MPVPLPVFETFLGDKALLKAGQFGVCLLHSFRSLSEIVDREFALGYTEDPLDPAQDAIGAFR